MQKVNSGSALCKLDLTDRKNIILCNKINIGCGATKVINNKIRTETATPREISKYKEECVTFLSTVLHKMFDQSPLKYSFTRYASSLSPTNMASKPDISANCFKSLCYSLNEVIKLSTKDSDIGFQEYKNFLQNVVFVSTEFKSYDRTESRLESRLKPETLVMTKELLKSVKSARIR